jgi:hypothetical protein
VMYFLDFRCALANFFFLAFLFRYYFGLLFGQIGKSPSDSASSPGGS